MTPGAVAVLLVGALGFAWVGGGDDPAPTRGGVEGAGRETPVAFSPDATYVARVSAIFVAVDPTDAADLIAPAPWCEVDVSEPVVADPLGPCADVTAIAAASDPDTVLDCRAEEAAVIAAADARLADIGRELDGLDSLVPTYLTEPPQHWDVVAPTAESSAGVVPRAVGLCAGLEPKLPPASLRTVECGAEYAAVTSAIDAYRLEFGVVPASVDDLAPAFLPEAPTNWTLPTSGDETGRTVVPAADGACVGLDD